MNITPVTVELNEEKSRDLKLIGHISYGLHAVVAVGTVMPAFEVSVLLLVVAFVLDRVKRPDALGSWQESHFRWRLHSVMWMGGLYLLTMPLFLLLYWPGKLAWFLISIWFAYRILRGWLSLHDQRAIHS
jgi:uncharacterized membrane protein